MSPNLLFQRCFVARLACSGGFGESPAHECYPGGGGMLSIEDHDGPVSQMCVWVQPARFILVGGVLHTNY